MNGLRKGLTRFCAGVWFRGKRFSPPWWSTLLMLACAALFIHLGQWQQDKAERKQAAQSRLDQRARSGPISFPVTLIRNRSDLEALQYAPVMAKGVFEPEHQFLVDNRVYQERAGYHVITPLRLVGSEVRLLVNRGWIPAQANHRDIPAIATPSGEIQLTGTAMLPGKRFFTLGKEDTSSQWQPLWQNLNLARFQTAVSYPVQPLVLQLDASAPAGFARDWPRPDERWEKHFSYALQWYGFAASALLIWFYLGWRKT